MTGARGWNRRLNDNIVAVGDLLAEYNVRYRRDPVTTFEELWTVWTSPAGVTAPLPKHWRTRARMLIATGLSVEDLKRAIEITMLRPGLPNDDSKFNYFAVVCVAELAKRHGDVADPLPAFVADQLKADQYTQRMRAANASALAAEIAALEAEADAWERAFDPGVQLAEKLQRDALARPYTDERQSAWEVVSVGLAMVKTRSVTSRLHRAACRTIAGREDLMPVLPPATPHDVCETCLKELGLPKSTRRREPSPATTARALR